MTIARNTEERFHIGANGIFWSKCGTLGIKDITTEADASQMFELFTEDETILERGPMSMIRARYMELLNLSYPFELILDSEPLPEVTSVRYLPQHLPVGTRYRIADPRLIEMFGTDRLTVLTITPNGVDNWAVTCVETREVPDPYVEGHYEVENLGHSISDVVEIIERPTELGPSWTPSKMKFRIRQFERHGRFIELKYLAQAISGASYLAFPGRHIDEDKFFKRTVAMGLLKSIMVPSKAVPGTLKRIYVVDYRKCLRFISKNPHFAFTNLKESRKREEIYWADVYKAFDNASE